MILKAHLIIMDFLNLRMPGMLDEVRTYISLERNGETPSIGVANLDPKVTLPGLIVF